MRKRTSGVVTRSFALLRNSASCRCLLIVAVWWPASVAIAQSAPADRAEQARTLDTIVVTGSRLSTPTMPLARNVIVLDTETIERRAAASTLDLLRPLVGLHVDRAGVGGFSGVYLRGADPNHALVLIDGVKANDPTNSRGGGFDFATLHPDSIGRIEVLPGAVSAVHGADAMAGVISITSPGFGDCSDDSRASAAIGGHGYRSLALRKSLCRSAYGAGAFASALRDEGAAGTGIKTRAAGASLRTKAFADAVVSLSLRAQHSDAEVFPDDSGGARYAVIRTLESREQEQAWSTLAASKSLGRGRFDARLSYADQSLHTISPGVAPGVRDPFGLPAFDVDDRVKRSAMEVSYRTDTYSDLSLLLGAGRDQDRGISRGRLSFGEFSLPTDFESRLTTNALFAEVRTPRRYPLQAQLGLRHDDSARYGDKYTWRGSLAFERAALPGMWLFSAGTGFKPPSFYALAHPIVGNSLLRPESSRSYEIGFYSKAAARLEAGATLFTSRTRDLIDFDPGPPPLLVNRVEVEIRGAQASLRGPLGEAVEAGVAATVLRYDLPAGVPPLRNRPRHKLSADLAADLGAHSRAFAIATWTGSSHDSSIATGDVRLPSALRLDIGVDHRWGRATLAAYVDDLLDRRAESFVGQVEPGRRLRVQVGVDF